MVWAGRDLRDHVVSTPLPWVGNLLLDQVTESLIFSTSRDGESTASLGKITAQVKRMLQISLSRCQMLFHLPL